MAEKALGWDVDVTADYTLAVDGVETTTLTLDSTREEIEVALNETSGPVGLDVVGEGSQFSVSTDTPAEMTATGGAVVTVTDPGEPEPGPDGETPVRVVIRIGGEIWFADDVYDPEYAFGGEGEAITFSATVAPSAVNPNP